jgi:hypothetical protein
MTLAEPLADSKTFLDVFPPGTIANVEKRFEPASEKIGTPAIQLRLAGGRAGGGIPLMATYHPAYLLRNLGWRFRCRSGLEGFPGEDVAAGTFGGDGCHPVR